MQLDTVVNSFQKQTKTLNKIEVIYYRKRGYVSTYGSLYLSFVSNLRLRLIFFIVSYSIVDKESNSILWSIVFESKLKPKQNRGYLLPKKRLCLYIRISIFQFRVELESLIFFIVLYSIVDKESNSILWSTVFLNKLKPKQNRGYLLPKKRLCLYIRISIFQFRVELESLIFLIVSYSIVDKKSNSILWSIVFQSKLKPKQNRGYLLSKKRLCLYIRISIFKFRVLEVSFDIFYSIVLDC